jgi:hypothetical protein
VENALIALLPGAAEEQAGGDGAAGRNFMGKRNP